MMWHSEFMSSAQIIPIMPLPRKSQISLSDTPYYHCVSRCVRRAYLCGKDALTGKSYEHRRRWVEQRLLLLAKLFAIDICAYAVMSNHTHVVLHVNRAQALAWSTREVIQRWHQLHRGTILTRRYISAQDALTCSEIHSVEEIAHVYRQRLFDISWFMRLLNEHIARRANKEDECTGRFWEGRFKSQALLDDAALAACMAYVDLNPVRAKIANSPEQSSYTSIKKRIRAMHRHEQPDCLYPLRPETGPGKQYKAGHSLPFTLSDYLVLVNCINSATQRRNDESKHCLARLFNETGLSDSEWIGFVAGIETKFSHKVCLAAFTRKIRRIS